MEATLCPETPGIGIYMVKYLIVTGGSGDMHNNKHSELAPQALGQAHQKYQIEGKLGLRG